MRHLVPCSAAVGVLLAAVALSSSPLVAQTQQWSTPAPAPESRPAAGAARAAAAGEKVLVLSGSTWYAAAVLEVGEAGYKVRYDGWGSAWDEWVPSTPAPRPATPPTTSRPTPAAPPATPPAPKVWSSSPVGLWKCRTWDYGQVNVVGEFTLKADGTYHDAFSKAGGRYTFDKAKGRIAFTSGPQRTSAPITFFPAGHAGKGHLQFDYGGGARLDCYREALK